MKVLVIHQVPDRKIGYRDCLDHNSHDVTYIGYPSRMADLPPDLRCRRIELDPGDELVAGITTRVSAADGFDHVLALSEFGILQAHDVRRHLGLPGPSREQLELVRDKVKMKEAVAAAGIRHPRFAPAPSPGGALPWSGRTVVKPRQGASSEGIEIHPSAADAVTSTGQRPDLEFEEYVDGDILYADGLVDAGKVIGFSVSRYVNTPLQFVAGLPLGAANVPAEEHRDFVTSAVEATRIEEGCFHLEFFLTPQGDAVFLEIANRVGGAGVINAHLGHTGVHLPAHEIAIRLGLPLPQPQPPSGRYHGWLVFPGHHLPGSGHASVGFPEHLRRHPCVERVYTLAPGEPLPDHVTYHEWLVPLFVEASHRDPAVLARFLRDCARSVIVEAKVKLS